MWLTDSRLIKVLFLLLLMMAMGLARAEGTAAGTRINNTVQVSFQVGDSPDSIHTETASHDFIVSELIRSNVSSLNPEGVAVPAPAQDVILTFELTNTGNGEETFMLSTDDMQSEFSAEITAMWIESNGEPGLQDDDTLYSEGVELQADQSVTVYVVGTIPPDQEHEAEAGVLLTATAATPGAGQLSIGEAIPPEQNNGVEAVVAQNNASANDSGVYIVSGIQLDVRKEVVSVRDPYQGNLVMPGSEITYQITVGASGKGTAQDLKVSDPSPASMSYKQNSLLLNEQVLSDRADDDKGYFDEQSDTVWFEPGTVVAPAIYQYKLTYVVD
uniref:DUF11 domain-containing protein n=1 Tax=uncultured Thiotrichaceae bacterium TaxID=298394 RepID=A0A6S6TRN5_9GAMM|nr:MAG: Unknown protein [uncultured Thiotrichaceae bacterium]